MGSNGRQFVIVMMMTLVAGAAVAEAQPNSDCPSSCGNLSVPYPFGTKQGCYMDDKFFIRCEAATNDSSAPQAFLQTSNINVLDIYLQDGQLRISNFVGYDCYNSSGKSTDFNTWLRSGLYNISSTRNVFTVIGCDTLATIEGSIGKKYGGACVSLCNEITDVINGSCSGIGCCQAEIPRGVRDYNITLGSLNNHLDVLSFNPCSYAFVVEDGQYNFSISDLSWDTKVRKKIPMILDWTIDDQISCSEAKKNLKSYACKGDYSSCYEPQYGKGYLCKCVDGYQGNPYLSNNCQDINECELYKPCNISTSTCHNTGGGYYCSCLKGYEGNDLKNGTDCKPKVVDLGRTREIQIAVGTSVSFVAALALSAWIFLICKKRNLIKLKEKFFLQNGGKMLQQLTGREASSETAKIYTANELKKATNNYDESIVVGSGGFATVYKGILEGKEVAIKRSRNMVDQGQVEQFINEVVVMSKIKHRNVVKLLGCCLEEQFPSLVYEFITNGTLFDHIHDKQRAAAMPWSTRLRIAADSAKVLSYLHSDASSTPIIHRDVKTTNILLDDSYTTKVSDFGASRLVPNDPTQLPTMVQGTLGYLDPEYLHSSQLTEKSDVYSFGVVLAELLTGREALAYDGPEEDKNLSRYFLSSLKKDRLFDIVERHLVNEENREQIMGVAMLAKRCLEIKGEERPSMKEVVKELEGLSSAEEHHVDSNSEIEKSYDGYGYGDGSNNNSGVYGSPQITLHLNGGR